MSVRREARSPDDGYRSELVPGLRSRSDATRLAAEIAFAYGRLLALAEDPPEAYGQARAVATGDPARASWICFLIAYLSPLESDDPFAGIRLAVERSVPRDDGTASDGPPGRPIPPDLDDIPLGPRSSHDATRGGATMSAFLQRLYVAEGGSLAGDPAWTGERRFARLFERLAVPGFGREGRFEMLVTLGRLGVHDLEPASLHLTPGRSGGEDSATLAAKRVFGIADPLLIDRRAVALVRQLEVPLAALDLALANWGEGVRVTLGFPEAGEHAPALDRAADALGL